MRARSRIAERADGVWVGGAVAVAMARRCIPGFRALAAGSVQSVVLAVLTGR